MNDLASLVASQTPPGAVETSPAAPADSELTGADTASCRRCGWQGDRGATGKGVCPSCKSFLRLNEVAVQHGLRRLRGGGGGSPLDEQRRVELVAAVLGDLGGQSEVSAVLSSLVVDFAAAVVLRDLASEHLAAAGPFTASGKRRAAVDLYLQASARAERLASMIGTTRRSRRVPTLDEAIDAAQRVPGS